MKLLFARRSSVRVIRVKGGTMEKRSLARRTIGAAVIAGALALGAPSADAMMAGPAGCSSWRSGDYIYNHCTDYDGSNSLFVTGAWGTPHQDYWHVYYW